MFVVWCYAPMECNGTNIIYDKYMLPAMELVKTNSLDTIGSKALDRLGDTLSKFNCWCTFSLQLCNLQTLRRDQTG